MNKVDRAMLDAAVAGAGYRDETASGVLPIRLSPSVAARGADDRVIRLSRQAAGVRLRLRTKATRIELEVETFASLGRQERPSGRPTVFTAMTADHRESVSVPTDGRTSVDEDGVWSRVDGRRRLTFHLGDASDDRDVTVWLPHRAETNIISLHADAPVAPAPSTRPRWAHYGSSISHCYEVDDPIDAWPTAAAVRLDVELSSYALAGQALLDPFVAKAIAAQPYEVISLEVGVNIVNGDAMRERVFVPALHGFLDRIRDAHPETSIVVMSPVYCMPHEHQAGPIRPDGAGGFIGTTPTDDLPHLTVGTIRPLIAEVVSARADSHLHYLAGTELLGPGHADQFTDTLHPNLDGYRTMTAAFVSWIREFGLFARRPRQPRPGQPLQGS
ncbi:GDSL-type esterase/lipase family protein [Jiangella endophytica]|uniref:GDSL-type esterase/lipase family protein n=1 Tax=Jiangella endophytica TaxID=1623398 RepID=UPI00130024FF|nr:GDSL-type esterase/lipase family protein [Jiangella endophytica]